MGGRAIHPSIKMDGLLAQIIMKVKDLMTTGVVTVEEDSPITVAAKKMKEENVGVVLVTKNGKLKGLLVDRDIVVKGIAEGYDVNKTPVRAIMTINPITATSDIEVFEAAKIMAEGKFRRLPVVEGDEIKGLISTCDVAHYAKFLSNWIFEEVSKARKKEIFVR